MSKIEDKTGFGINIYLLARIRDVNQYWKKAYDFVNDMQSKTSFTEAQEDWLEKISSTVLDAYMKATDPNTTETDFEE